MGDFPRFGNTDGGPLAGSSGEGLPKPKLGWVRQVPSKAEFFVRWIGWVRWGGAGGSQESGLCLKHLELVRTSWRPGQEHSHRCSSLRLMVSSSPHPDLALKEASLEGDHRTRRLSSRPQRPLPGLQELQTSTDGILNPEEVSRRVGTRYRHVRTRSKTGGGRHRVGPVAWLKRE
ncbi:hypothetical protein HPB47_026911 [Ixodes persulcatus]|uniref:Uncharacterized protein n=1 Tax=Ixodes persulcatus TaxID=34615 RepID=A0AC60PX87_IXOPE|nr:hypothetical protein HPB47_026911 [Ixodes persulcatus]